MGVQPFAVRPKRLCLTDGTVARSSLFGPPPACACVCVGPLGRSEEEHSGRKVPDAPAAREGSGMFIESRELPCEQTNTPSLLPSEQCQGPRDTSGPAIRAASAGAETHTSPVALHR
ncbi:hypothetical protein MRX96_010673 [Rhipicephalus microplus]